MRAGRWFLTFVCVFVVGAATVQPTGAQELSSRLAAPVFAPAELVGTGQATDVVALDQDVPGVTKTEDHPAPQHTGFSAFARALGSDFAAFPRRPSTWVILG